MGESVLKYLKSFCKCLPGHVDCWKSILQESQRPLGNLSNLCEQRCHVKRARLKGLENFNEIKETLLFQISSGIEEVLLQFKDFLDQLNRTNSDLKNKLTIFERSTTNLDWEENCELIKGNGFQPSLERLLQNSLLFINFFTTHLKNISESYKSINCDDLKSIRKFQASFDVNLEDENVISLIALTQYIDNVNRIL